MARERAAAALRTEQAPRGIPKARAPILSRLDRISQKWDTRLVRRVLATDEKPLHWVGSSKRDFLEFPEAVKDDMGNALGIAQFGGTAPTAKPWKGLGSGVLEIVEDHDGNAYRAVYTVRFPEAVYVLHAFQKKSPSGIRTHKRDVELVAQRLRVAQQDYGEYYGKPKR
jgi:phage-related protein